MNTPTEALSSQGRFDLAPAATLQLPRRLLTWTLWQAAAWLALVALGLSGSLWAPVLALGLAASTARPRHLPLAVVVVPLVVAAAWLASLASLPVWSAAGLVAGLCAAWLELGRRPKWRLLNAALAGAALFPLAVVTQRALALALPPVLASPISILTASLLPALTLAVMAVDWRAVARIPSPRRIRATLAARYRDPCLKAWETDRVVRGMAPDRETREGLGEVAAWVYRLSLALQEQDQELELLAGEGITEKVEAARAAVYATDDPYTRDRRQATLRHLELMEQHAEALALERQRTESLLDYASATLAEARAGLAFSRKGAGFPAPEGLDQVLGRLRAHATEEAARRDTARELESATV
ncbi:MAG: hypothetical protein ABIO70_25695 [Pseudomonadota bacterium]